MKLICTHCTKEFERRQSWVNKSKNHFCSRSCAASFNNKKSPKRKAKLKECFHCNRKIRGKNKYCSPCFNSLHVNSDNTLEDILDKHECHRSTAYSKVRQRARIVAKKHNFNSCIICGYSKHIEVCHIKDIHKHKLDEKISVINDPKNLVPLCPNCHWEFDNNQISREFIINAYKKSFPKIWN